MSHTLYKLRYFKTELPHAIIHHHVTAKVQTFCPYESGSTGVKLTIATHSSPEPHELTRDTYETIFNKSTIYSNRVCADATMVDTVLNELLGNFNRQCDEVAEDYKILIDSLILQDFEEGDTVLD